MKRSSAVDFSRFCQLAAHRAMYEHVGIELAFRYCANDSPGQSRFLVDVTDLGENRVVFCFPDTSSGAYAITDICFHDDGLLGFAAVMDYVSEPDTESPLAAFRLSNNPGQPDADGPTSIPCIHDDGVIDIKQAAHSQVTGRHDSWVAIFDLETGTSFADIIYALSTGRLRITIKVKNPDTGKYRLLFNEQALVPRQSGFRKQPVSGALRSIA